MWHVQTDTQTNRLVYRVAAQLKITIGYLYPHICHEFFQLFVIYKFGNVIVNKNKAVARFAFMHCIGASLCFWIYTIKNETLDSYVEKLFHEQIGAVHQLHKNMNRQRAALS